MKSVEITNATALFEELVAQALKMESSKRKNKHRRESSDKSDSSISSSSKSDSTDYERKRRKIGRKKTSKDSSKSLD